MSQQAAARQGAGQGGGRKPKFIPRGGGLESLSKAFRSSTSGIEKWTWWNANMSQQAAAGRGAGRGSGRKPKFIPRGGGVKSLSKTFWSSTSGIEKWTFNTGQNKFAAQFMLSCEEVANYIQRSSRAVKPSGRAEQLSRAVEPSSRAKRLSRAVKPSSRAEQSSRAVEPSSGERQCTRLRTPQSA
jgi:hypothetical protein